MTYILPAVAIHLIDYKSAHPSHREMILRRLQPCLRIIQGLSERYTAAMFIYEGLETHLRKIGIQAQGQATQSRPRRSQISWCQDGMSAPMSLNPDFEERGVTLLSQPATHLPSAATTPHFSGSGQNGYKSRASRGDGLPSAKSNAFLATTPPEDSWDAASPDGSHRAAGEADISDIVENIFLEDSSQRFYGYSNSNILPENCIDADMEMGLEMPWSMEDIGVADPLWNPLHPWHYLS